MRSLNKPFRTAVHGVTACLLTVSTLAYAQDQTLPPTPDQSQQQPSQQDQGTMSNGWPQAQNQNPPDPNAQAPAQDPNSGAQQYPQPQPAPQQYPTQQYPTQQYPAQQYPAQQYPAQQYPQYPTQQYPQQPYPAQQPSQPVPAQLTLQAGTYIVVRVNQFLSSDKNQVGDAFSASLVQPIVVNGVVVAEPGQTIGGRVAEAQKAGRIEGTARLGVQLTDLSIVDGQQIPIQTQLVSRQGPTSVGRDVGAVAGTTALGAAVGAAAAWGRGAAIGAGAGLLVGTLGVLVTRGQPSIITPEQILTFKIMAPVTVSTDHSPQAFRYVEPGEYDRPAYSGGPGYAAGPPPAPGPYYGYYPYPNPYYAYSYPYWGGVYFGPSVFIGRGFYGPRFYYGRGFRR